MVIMGKRMLLFSSSLMIMCSCCINERNTESSYSKYNRISGCKMDSTINEFRLMVPMLLDSILMIPVDSYMVDNRRYGEGIYVSNDSEKEFLFLKVNCGRTAKELDAFILTDSISSEYKPYIVLHNVSRFVSTHGSFIGMCKTEFINIYFDNNAPQKEFDSEYEQYDSLTLLYNHFIFCNDTLKQIEIGYDW